MLQTVYSGRSCGTPFVCLRPRSSRPDLSRDGTPASWQAGTMPGPGAGPRPFRVIHGSALANPLACRPSKRDTLSSLECELKSKLYLNSLVSPVESALTLFSPANSFRIRTYEKHIGGGGGTPPGRTTTPLESAFFVLEIAVRPEESSRASSASRGISLPHPPNKDIPAFWICRPCRIVIPSEARVRAERGNSPAASAPSVRVARPRL